MGFIKDKRTNRSSFHRLALIPAAAAIAVFCSSPAQAGLLPTFSDPISSLPDAVIGGTPNLNVRVRYETVNQHNLPDNANGVIARARLGFTTKQWNGLFGKVEFQGITDIGDDQFNSTENGRVVPGNHYPTIADPSGSNFDQLYIGYAGLPDTVIRYGRQRIVYDNARFIGDVGWRQRMQTYDGVTLTGTWLPKLRFDYAYLTNIDSFQNIPNATYPGDPTTKNVALNATQLFHLSYTAAHWLKLTGYTYLINFANDHVIPPLNFARRDTATYGGRVTGKFSLHPVKLNYLLEYARQTGYAASPSSVQANYYAAELGASYWRLFGKLDYEVLGGDGHYAFQTPLYTGHAFQGDADQFAFTPAAGMEDFYVTVGAKVEKAKLSAVWHNFNSNDSSSSRYGSEIDLKATRPINKILSAGIGYAYYTADHNNISGEGMNNVSKGWLWLVLKI